MPRTKHGVALLETLVALAILSGAGLALLDLLTSGGDPVIFDLAQDRGGDIGVGGYASLENPSSDSFELNAQSDRYFMHASILDGVGGTVIN